MKNQKKLRKTKDSSKIIILSLQKLYISDERARIGSITGTMKSIIRSRGPNIALLENLLVDLEGSKSVLEKIKMSKVLEMRQD